MDTIRVDTTTTTAPSNKDASSSPTKPSPPSKQQQQHSPITEPGHRIRLISNRKLCVVPPPPLVEEEEVISVGGDNTMDNPNMEQPSHNQPSVHSGDCPAVELLRRLEQFLQTPQVYEELERRKIILDPSLRAIQGNRYEIFCKVDSKPSDFFDWICQQLQQKEEQEDHSKLGELAARIEQPLSGEPRVDTSVSSPPPSNSNNNEDDRSSSSHKQKEDRSSGELSSRIEHQQRAASPSSLLPSNKQDDYDKSKNYIKDTILSYAIAQSERDPRCCNGILPSPNTNEDEDKEHISNHSSRRKYGNFSLLVNYGPAPVQLPHIDLLYPNFQYGLVLTEGAPATHIYEPKETITSLEQLKQYAWTDIPDTLLDAMERNPTVRILVKDFGSVLAKNIELHRDSQTLRCATGTVLSLPGGIIHAGPPCTDFRAMMFFSSHDPDNPHGMQEYNPDTQYFQPLLMCDITSCVWNYVPSNADKLYLVNKLVQAMQRNNYVDLHKHFGSHLQNGNCRMAELTKNLANFLRQPAKMNKYIRKVCHDDHLSLEPILYYDKDGNLLHEISVDHLHAMFEGVFYRCRVFQRTTDGSVCLMYPSDGTWEGWDPPYYQLEMKESTGTKRKGNQEASFNGSNGILREGGGEIIKCYVRKPQKRRGGKFC